MWLVVWSHGKNTASLCLCKTREEAEQFVGRVSVVAEVDAQFSIEFVPVWTATPIQSED